MNEQDAAVIECATSKAHFASLFFASDGFLKGGRLPPFAPKMWRLLDEKHPQTAVILPRGHAKTTLVTVIDTVWEAIHEPGYTVIVTATQDLAADLSRVFDAVFRGNELLQSFYGKLATDDEGTWNQSVKELKNGATIRIATQGQQLRGTKDRRGRRPRVIKLDDIETTEQAQSDARTADLLRWYLSEARPALDPTHGRIVLVGNIISKRSMTYRIAAGEIAGWQTLKYPCVNFETGWLLWPGHERFSVDYFRELRDTMGPAFWSEYMNRPIDDVDLPFQPGALQRFPALPEGVPLRWFAAIDLAYVKKAGSDSTAWAVGAMDWRGQLYVVEARKAKLSLEERENLCFDLAARYPLHTIHIEGNPDFIDSVHREQSRRKLAHPGYRSFALEPLKPGGKAKADRILALRPNLRYIWLHETQTSELVAELTSWSPTSSIDDLSDAMAYLWQIAAPAHDRPSQGDSRPYVPDIVKAVLAAKAGNKPPEYDLSTDAPPRL